MEKLRIQPNFLENLQERRKQKAERSERASVVKEFVEIINKSRVQAGYKEHPASYFAFKMSHLDLWDLKMFLADCKRAKNFGAYWNYALRTKEITHD